MSTPAPAVGPPPVGPPAASATPAATPADAAEPLVVLRDLRVRFGLRRGLLSRERVDVHAVDGVTLSIERGRTLGLVGATGSGKSTVAHVVMGMVAPTSGEVIVAGRDLAHLRSGERLALQRLVQVVLQDPYSSLDPRMRVGDIIAEPLRVGGPGGRRPGRAETRARVAELLELVGLRADRAARYPHQFSGGQRQRIAIARALAPRPRLIVLDEPTSALDVSVRAQILTLLKALQAQLGITYLVISHDLVTVAYLASEVAVMHLGRIIERGPVSALYRAPRHPYTLELLSSAPGASGSFLRQPRPTGVSPADLPPGACRYAYRCTLRTALGDPARCLEEDPGLDPVGPDHRAACHFSDRVARLAEEA
jgi:oligopeptide/dipeptide ABC transporter ATP-binding protein